MPSRQAWNWLAGFFQRHFCLLALAVASTLAPTLVLPLMGALIRHAFDVDIPAGQTGRLAWAAAGVLLLFLANSAFAYLTRRRILSAAKQAITRLRAAMLQALYATPWTRFTAYAPAELHGALVEDTRRVDAMSVALLGDVAPGVLVSATLWLYLMAIEWRLGLLFTGLLLTMGLLTIAWRGPMKEAAQDHRGATNLVSGNVLFALRAMLLTRTEAAEAAETSRQRVGFAALRDAGIRNVGIQSAYRIAQDTLNMAFVLIILVLGGVYVKAGWMSLGDLLASFVVVNLIRAYSQRLASGIPQVIDGLAALERLHELACAGSETPDENGEHIDFGGSITFEDVSFGFPGRKLLKRVSLSIRPGSMLVLMGSNGSGKSSLTHLLLGLHHPCEGRLLAEGRPYSALNLAHLRQQISYVPQEPVIFAGTLLENVSYGCPGASREAALEALHRANADALVKRLPEGLDSSLEQDGFQLSGGERQKLALARAFLKGGRLFLLDEPTNHLDSASVLAVLETLRALPEAPALVVVSHDEAVIQAADMTYRLDEARLLPVPTPPGRGKP